MPGVLSLVLVATLAGCPRGPEPVEFAEEACPTLGADLNTAVCVDLPQGYGVDPEHPLEWGPAGVGTLWYGRLACPGGGDPLISRLGEAGPPPRRSSAVHSGVPGDEELVQWSVHCPGQDRPRLWAVNPHRCGLPCPPEGFLIVRGEAMAAFALSRGAFSREDYATARHLAEAAVDADDRTERLWFWLGITALQQEDTPVALEGFQRAASIDPTDVDNLYYLAVAQRTAGLEPQSQATVLKALEHLTPAHPARPRVLCMGAVMRRDRGEHSEAALLGRAACEEGFEECCALFPPTPGAPGPP